ncbi:ATP-binding protein [Candidatus Uabimicrobium sp. HlEnr_7]|uniref:ATP-binding protein n=1 Tax=Candidatus Uabimicrobium helgolandensis TaxID=3095367 RepID=UPI003557D649
MTNHSLNEEYYPAAKIVSMNTMECIRKRPGMYIGSTCQKGIEHLVKELVANTVDLFLRNKARRVKIKVTKNQIIVGDDGPGLPFLVKAPQSKYSLAHQYLTEYHNSATSDGHAPHIHLQYTGAGMVVVNALSERLVVESFQNNQKWTQIYKRGVIENSCVEKKKGKGTTFTFTPDRTIFPISDIHRESLRSSLFQCAHLFPGLEINYNREKFLSKNGLTDFICLYDFYADHTMQYTPPFSFYRETKDFLIQVAAIGQRKRKGLWLSWVNGTSTCEHGSHVNALKKALRNCKWKPTVAAIHIILKQPQFAGPVKAKLSNREIVSPIVQLLEEPLRKYLHKISKI